MSTINKALEEMAYTAEDIENRPTDRARRDGCLADHLSRCKDEQMGSSP